MTKQRAILMGSVAVLLLAGVAFAHEGADHKGAEHKVVGTVSTVDATHLNVTTQDGRAVGLVFDKDTRFLRGKDKVAPESLTAGERVVVTYVEDNGAMKAQEVRLSGKSDKGK